jgi:hypothetical protein
VVGVGELVPFRLNLTPHFVDGVVEDDTKEEELLAEPLVGKQEGVKVLMVRKEAVLEQEEALSTEGGVTREVGVSKRV